MPSVRLGGTSYEFSTSYSVPPSQLIQLLLPYLYRPEQSPYWGLWSPAETTIYVGIAPLLLTLLAATHLRTRVVLFFGALGLVSLLLALGDYLPFRLYGLVTALPGFSVMRVPARFSMLFVLSAGILAGCGVDWLSGPAFDVRPGRLGWRRLRLTLICFAFALTALMIAGAFLMLRPWVADNGGSVREAIKAYYLSVRHGEIGLSMSSVYFGLLRSLDLSSPRTLGALALMVSVPLTLLLRGHQLVRRRPWQVAVLALAVIDLVSFGQGFYPERPVGSLHPTQPAARFLAERAGLHRVFVEPSLFGMLGPNQLADLGIDLASGYSSLQPSRQVDYWWGMVRQDNVLLDLYNVRYVVGPRLTLWPWSYEGTLFHPADRLMRGAVGNPSGTETFVFSPAWTEALSVVAGYDGLRDVPYGTPLAEITLSGPTGEQRLVLRAGQDVDDSAAPIVGPRLPGITPGPNIVWAGPSVQNARALTALSGSTLPLEQPMLATSLTIQRVGPAGLLDVYGLGLHDREGLPVRSVMTTNRAKYHRVYEDIDVQILENDASLPRAFVAGSALPAGPGPIVDQLLREHFDPRQTILVEGAGAQSATDGGDPGTANIVDYEPERVVVDLTATTAGYLVLTDRFEEGWKATLDGQDAPIVRADGLFRAVAVTPGSHEVTFTYEPWLVRVGGFISVISGVIALSALVWVLRGARVP